MAYFVHCEHFQAIYCDSNPTSVKDFMCDFLLELQRLTVDGVDFAGQVIRVSLFAFICDAPARAFFKGIKQHSGYFSCERCTMKGEWHDRVVFNCDGNNQDLELRTDDNFLQQHYKNHQISRSILVDYGIHCVSQFPLDYMHLVCLGVVRRMLRFLKSGEKLCRISP